MVIHKRFKIIYKGILTSLTEYIPNRTVIRLNVPILKPRSALDNASESVEILIPQFSSVLKADGTIPLYNIMLVQMIRLHRH